MFLKFEFPDRHMPIEFGDDKNDSVYFINAKKLHSKTVEERIDFFGPLSKINLFVGANNSGKSRFLRGLLKANNSSIQVSLFEKSIDYLFEEYATWIKQNFNSLNRIDYRIGNDISRIKRKVDTIKKGYRTVIANSAQNISLLEEVLQERIKDLTEIKRATGKMAKEVIEDSKLYGKRIEAIVKKLEIFEILKELRNEIEYGAKNEVNNKIYIPILRSIKKSTKINQEAFVNTAIELFKLDQSHYKIFTGLDLFEQVLEIRNDIKKERKGFENFELFLSKYFFEGKSVEIISHLKEEVIRIYVDGEERRVHDIGDGIQSIILLMFPIFTALENTWIFIEEPEVYLHPGLQRVFIETLINDEYLNSKNLKYYFTTHSNHFLDLSIESREISILQFQKVNKEKFDIKTNVKPDKEVLDVLGVNTSSVFLANTSLWVEGPTDRKYLSFFLKKYCAAMDKPYLKEDIDFAFFEYGGNLIAHYLFESEKFDTSDSVVREKINSFASANKIYLLADDDGSKASSTKGKRRKKLQELSDSSDDFKYQNTELREIENLLPKKIIKEFLKGLVDEQHQKKLSDIDFNKKEYDKIGLGGFYQKILKEGAIPASAWKSFKAASGTLKSDYKTRLCDFTVNAEISYEEMVEQNPILNEIIENLYAFIKK
ncbi:AAA family ATPase [uncultured Croceitalea sp.]|uniref:AAA family ATPase n=1 Tax=uncultured Croceitalea sp. TaxID=1798908 RepID=UPI0033068DA9